jgi:hypothetical protein
MMCCPGPLPAALLASESPAGGTYPDHNKLVTARFDFFEVQIKTWQQRCVFPPELGLDTTQAGKSRKSLIVTLI